MGDTGETTRGRGWQVWLGVVAVLAIVAAGAVVSPRLQPSDRTGNHAGASPVVPVSPSPSSVHSAAPAPTASGETCMPGPKAGESVCGRYSFSSGGNDSVAPSVDRAAAEPSAPASQRVPPSAVPPPPARDAVVRRLAGWDRVDAECLLVVYTLSPAEVVRRMGGDGKHIPADSETDSPDRSVTGVVSRAGRTVLLIDNGWSCNDETVLKRLTAGGVTAVSAYWNADADTLLSYARNGVVLATWDPIIDDRQGPHFSAVLPAVARVSADVDAHPNAAMVAVVAALSGVEVRADSKVDYTVWLPNP